MTNKLEIKKFCELVEERIEKNERVSFSSWHKEPFSSYVGIAKEMYENTQIFVFNGQEYIISYSPSRQGRGGMDEGSPDTYTVAPYEKNKMNVDDYLNTKEVLVSDFHGGQSSKKVEELFLKSNPIEFNSNKDISNIVDHILNNSTYNILVQRNNSDGNVIIWIDDKRFTQR